MSYKVLALKWRPQNFAELIGQQHVLQTLVHALKNNRLHHAYLFSGTRGVGKTSIARILAKCLNCEQGITDTPCGKCQSCIEISEGRFVDLIEIDAASRTKVEDTREILDNVQYAPTRGRFKIYLIDEVHMLSTSSFNALLKTLEEPPPHVKFLLATTDPQKLPVTVLSRCLQFNLKNVTTEVLAKHLSIILEQEKISFVPEAVVLIARASKGSVRDALSILDQAIAFSDNDISVSKIQLMLGLVANDHIYKILQAIFTEDSNSLLSEVELLAEKATDYDMILTNISRLLFQISLQQAVNTVVTEEFSNEFITEFAAKVAPEAVQVLYQISILGRRDLKLAPDLKLGFEMTLLRMLSFRPLDAYKAVPENLKKTTPVTTTKPAVTNTSQPVTKPTVTKVPVQAAPISVAKPVSAPAPTPVSTSVATPASIAPVANSTDSWQATVNQIKLPGMAKQLALNSSLLSKNGTLIKLQIADKHKGLASEALTKRLENALSEFYNEKIKLEISSSGTKLETPAVATEREIANKQQLAEENIHQDQNLKFLQAEFNATIVPDSIKPI